MYIIFCNFETILFSLSKQSLWS